MVENESAINSKVQVDTTAVFVTEKGLKELKVAEHIDARVEDFQLPSIIKVGAHTITKGRDGKIERKKIDRSKGTEIGD